MKDVSNQTQRMRDESRKLAQSGRCQCKSRAWHDRCKQKVNAARYVEVSADVSQSKNGISIQMSLHDMRFIRNLREMLHTLIL